MMYNVVALNSIHIHTNKDTHTQWTLMGHVKMMSYYWLILFIRHSCNPWAWPVSFIFDIATTLEGSQTKRRERESERASERERYEQDTVLFIVFGSLISWFLSRIFHLLFRLTFKKYALNVGNRLVFFLLYN